MQIFKYCLYILSLWESQLSRDIYIHVLKIITWHFLITVLCEEVATPDNSDRHDSTDGLFSYMEFSCVNSYHLVGDSVIKCQHDGIWNGSLPSCGEILPGYLMTFTAQI